MDAGSQITDSPTGGDPPTTRTALETAALVVIALACSQVGYVGHPRYGPFVAVADVACVLLAAAWLAAVYRRGRLRELTWPPLATGAWIAAGVLSIAMAALDPEGMLSLKGIKGGVIEIMQVVMYFVVAYMLLVDLLGTPACVRRALDVLLYATTVVVVWGLADYLRLAAAMDVKAGFANRNVYSAFLVMTLPLLLGVAIWGRDRWRQAWVAALAGVATLTMLGPPHVWLLCGVLCWVAWRRGASWRHVFVPAAVAFTVLLTLAVPRNRGANVAELFDPYERGELYKLETATDEGGGRPGAGVLIVKKRWLEWQPALMMICENLPLGVGAGSFQSRIGEARYYGALPNVKKGEPDTNNFYLVMGASMGFAGLLAVGAMLGWFWRRCRGAWAVDPGLAAGLTGSLAGIMAANLFTSLFVRGISLIWALVFALVAIAGQWAAAQGRQPAPGAPQIPTME